MRQIRAFSNIIPNNWTMIGASILYGILLGYAVGAGRAKVYSLLLLPTAIFIIRYLSGRIKFWLLALSIPLSVVQIPSLPLPYGTQISEVLLILLGLDEILFVHPEQKQEEKQKFTVMFSLLVLFAVGGWIANIRNNNINSWNVYCLMPLAIFFVISRKIQNREDARLLTKFALLTIIGFIAILQLAIMTGLYNIYDPISTETTARLYRMADGIEVTLGPIRLVSFATRLGAITALGIPTAVLFWLEDKGTVWRKLFLLSLIGGLCYVIILSATRGSLIAAVVGSLIVFLFSGRIRSPIVLWTLSLSTIVLIFWGEALINILPAYNVNRLLSLTQGVQSIANYNQRLDVLKLSWDLALSNPFGVGFGYLFQTYRIDDAVIYAVILQATGIIGSIAFITTVGYLTLKFGLIAFRSQRGFRRDFTALGLGTLATGVLAGVSSQSILFEPVHSVVFWTLLAVCFCSIVLPPSKDSQ